MEINMIFKIAAVGIIVSVVGQILKHSGREEQAFFDKSGRSYISLNVDCPIHI